MLTAALAAAALAVAGCGSSKSSGVSAATYVNSICTSASHWQAAVETAGNKLQSIANTKSLTAAKTGYVQFVDTLASATSSTTNDLASAGTPAVSNGKSIAQTLVQVFTKAKASLNQAAADATHISTKSKSAFTASAGKVNTDVRNALSGMAKLAPEKNPQLHAAATKDPTCRSLETGA